MLRMNPAGPIRSCSKAPGVFSSNYRYPASSPELHFHRASPRDSSPLITPFVHVGIYPTRNCALRFLLAREGPYLLPYFRRGLDVWPLRVKLDSLCITAEVGNLVFFSAYPITVLVLPHSSLATQVRNLRTIIVIADIHRGLHSPATHRSM